MIQILFSAIAFPSFAANSSAEIGNNLLSLQVSFYFPIYIVVLMGWFVELLDVREDLRVYSDEENKFKIMIPQGEFCFIFNS